MYDVCERDSNGVWTTFYVGEGEGSHLSLGGIPGVTWIDASDRNKIWSIDYEDNDESPRLEHGEKSTPHAVRRFLLKLASRRGRQLKTAGQRLWPHKDHPTRRKNLQGLVNILDGAESEFANATWFEWSEFDLMPEFTDERWWELAALSLVMLNRVQPCNLGLPGHIGGPAEDFEEGCHFAMPDVELAKRELRWTAIGFRVLLRMGLGLITMTNGCAMPCAACQPNCACIRPALATTDDKSGAQLGIAFETMKMASFHRQAVEAIDTMIVENHRVRGCSNLETLSLAVISTFDGEIVAKHALDFARAGTLSEIDIETVIAALEHVCNACERHPREDPSIMPTQSCEVVLKMSAQLLLNLGGDPKQLLDCAERLGRSERPRYEMAKTLTAARNELRMRVDVRRELAAQEVELKVANSHESGSDADVDWKEIQGQLLGKRERGERYTSVRKLAAELGCSDSTIGKAIRESETLKQWATPAEMLKGAPPATGLHGPVVDRLEQSSEASPESTLPKDEVDLLLSKLIQEADDKTRAYINGLDEEGRKRLAATYQSQQEDFEPSPLDPNGPDGKPGKVKSYKRA